MKNIGEQFDIGIARAMEIKDKAMEAGLRHFGNYIIEYAAKTKEAGNITYNLQDSYGYAIYKNGKIVGNPTMIHSIANEPDSEGGYGTERGKRFLESFHPKSNGFSIVIVAGEFYSSFLENEKNLDVLIQAMFHSSDSFSQYFRKMA